MFIIISNSCEINRMIESKGKGKEGEKERRKEC
jgi:hypothetical protein